MAHTQNTEASSMLRPNNVRSVTDTQVVGSGMQAGPLLEAGSVPMHSDMERSFSLPVATQHEWDFQRHVSATVHAHQSHAAAVSADCSMFQPNGCWWSHDFPIVGSGTMVISPSASVDCELLQAEMDGHAQEDDEATVGFRPKRASWMSGSCQGESMPHRMCHTPPPRDTMRDSFLPMASCESLVSDSPSLDSSDSVSDNGEQEMAAELLSGYEQKLAQAQRKRYIPRIIHNKPATNCRNPCGSESQVSSMCQPFFVHPAHFC